MAAATVCPVVIFPADYDAQSEFETPSRGYLSEVLVQTEDGVRHELFFIDLTRLGQCLADNVRDGDEYYAEPNLIVLPKVTTESIRKAVEGLWREGYFERLKPVSRYH